MGGGIASVAGAWTLWGAASSGWTVAAAHALCVSGAGLAAQALTAAARSGCAAVTREFWAAWAAVVGGIGSVLIGAVRR